jgi:hypothetical protein
MTMTQPRSPRWALVDVRLTHPPSGPSVMISPRRAARLIFLVQAAFFGGATLFLFREAPVSVLLMYLSFLFLVVILTGLMYLRPRVSADAEGIRGRGMGAERSARWVELDRVGWTHRRSQRGKTTEVRIVRKGRREGERLCALHYFESWWRTPRASREASATFLSL